VRLFTFVVVYMRRLQGLFFIIEWPSRFNKFWVVSPPSVFSGACIHKALLLLRKIRARRMIQRGLYLRSTFSIYSIEEDSHDRSPFFPRSGPIPSQSHQEHGAR